MWFGKGVSDFLSVEWGYIIGRFGVCVGDFGDFIENIFFDTFVLIF